MEPVAGASDIEWTDATWNPVAVCTVLSPGCTNCYAMRMAARLEAMRQPKYQGLTCKSGRRHVWTDNSLMACINPDCPDYIETKIAQSSATIVKQPRHLLDLTQDCTAALPDV